MSITFVRGDIFLTSAQAIALGLSAAGRLGLSAFYTAIGDRYPVFVSECHKRGRASTLETGGVWVWNDGQPWLVGLVVRETAQGAARLRYVEAALLNLYQNWEREGLRSLALMRLADDIDWPPIRELIEQYLGPLALPVIVYEAYQPGVYGELGDENTPSG
jgi:hypothetical protein